MSNPDAKCNELFRKLDAMKAEGRDNTPEYMALLLQTRAATRERLAECGMKIPAVRDEQ